LLAHYPDHLARRVRDLRSGEGSQPAIHTVVIWTKDPANLLCHEGVREALAGVGQVFLHWTVTGLGGTFLEPNVPPAPEQLSLLDDVVAYLGDPRRIHWRYDPLISARRAAEHAGNVDIGLFRSLAQAFARAAGAPPSSRARDGEGAVVHTSFATLYRKVIRRLAAAGVTAEEFSSDARRAFLDQMATVAGELGMKLVTCCEPGYPTGRCIDGELLAGLHPAHEPCATTRARDQRELCGCTASLDIGRYLPCPNRCLYCYAHPAG
jgi:hypothetical protein